MYKRQVHDNATLLVVVPVTVTPLTGPGGVVSGGAAGMTVGEGMLTGPVVPTAVSGVTVKV